MIVVKRVPLLTVFGSSVCIYLYFHLNLDTYEGCSETIQTLLVIHTPLRGKLSKYDVVIYQHLLMTY